MSRDILNTYETTDSTDAGVPTRVTGTDIGNKRALDVTSVDGLLNGVNWDYVGRSVASNVVTLTYKNGGSGGTTTAVIVVTYEDACLDGWSSIERTS